jgi:hypothetical protein
MNGKTVRILLSCLILLLTCLHNVEAQNQAIMETFFEVITHGIKVQVNATSEAQPTSSISAILSLTSEITKVYVKTLNFTVYGFENGTTKVKIYSDSTGNFELNKAEQHISQHQIFIPERVYGVLYAEIDLDYDATVKDELGGEHSYSFQDKLGFTMTRVQNTYLTTIEEQLTDLLNLLNQLNQTFQTCFGRNLTLDDLLSLNQTYWQLKHQYEDFIKVKDELNNTRATVAVLGVTTVVFLATTAYLIFRKPKEYW